MNLLRLFAGKFAASVALMALLGLLVVPASASDVQKNTVVLTGFTTTHDTWCTGFNNITITETATFRVTFTQYFDASGNLIKSTAHLDSKGVLTGPTGKSVSDNWVLNETLSDFTNPTDPLSPPNLVAIHGVQYHITVPGQGVITLAAGDVILDFANNSFKFSPTYQKQNYIAVCSLLAP